jgi:hypothetical protein
LRPNLADENTGPRKIRRFALRREQVRSVGQGCRTVALLLRNHSDDSISQ